MPSIDAQPLIQFAEALLTAGGLPADQALVTAKSLVDSNLRGYDSHGVMRIPYYLEMLGKGEIHPDEELQIVSEREGTLVADARWGVGQVQMNRLMDLLRAKVKKSGAVTATMVQCSHIGRLGEYCEAAARDGYVSMIMVNSNGAIARVAPPGGKAPRLSTNPIAVGIPHGDTPVVADFSTSATAEGKVRVKRIAGESCPEGWLVDSSGEPTTDPQSLYADPPGSILPMGGPQMYKGFALGIMVEAFTGALSGGSVYRTTTQSRLGNCVFVNLIDPGAFGGAEHFGFEVDQLVNSLRGCPRREGVDRIILPGDPERDVLQSRQTAGIPFDDGNWGALTKLATELGVAVPAVRT